MEVRALDGPFGAEVLGLDLTAPLTEGEREAANRAFAGNVVLCFRGQRFERPEQFRAAVLNLGDPMPPVTATCRLPGFDEIEELTNAATDRRTGDRTPLRRGGSWHTDHSNLERPPKATVLHAIEVPEQGGNTEFTSLYLAYEALADEDKETLRGRRAFHAYLSRRAPRKLLTRSKLLPSEDTGRDSVGTPFLHGKPAGGSWSGAGLRVPAAHTSRQSALRTQPPLAPDHTLLSNRQAEYKELAVKLAEKVHRSLAAKRPDAFTAGSSLLQDATDRWPQGIDQLDAVITSPPFYDSTRFHVANWIRL